MILKRATEALFRVFGMMDNSMIESFAIKITLLQTEIKNWKKILIGIITGLHVIIYFTLLY